MTIVATTILTMPTQKTFQSIFNFYEFVSTNKKIHFKKGHFVDSF